jgi:hypothetical protein
MARLIKFDGEIDAVFADMNVPQHPGAALRSATMTRSSIASVMASPICKTGGRIRRTSL